MAGEVVQGATNINTSVLPNGFYLIRFTNGSQQFVEKFVKQ
jgi:hypothetical protein